jgi:hypothetical protein
MTHGAVWREEELDGLRLLRGQLDALEVALLPEVGGKMVSLRAATRAGAEPREWLWQTPRRPYRTPAYGGAFDAYDISGFDECFPGIGEGPYPLPPWEAVTVPDHGEVWTLPWAASVGGPDGETLTLAVHGVRFPYRLDKQLTLEKRSAAAHPDRAALRIDYRLANLCPFPLRYLWSAHPLFAAHPGMRVELPPDVALRVDWSRDARLGPPGARHAWPHTRDAAGATTALDVLPPAGAGFADKLYTQRLRVTGEDAHCALVDIETGEYIGFRFDPAAVPYLGLWLNMDGWPLDGQPCFNVALEPCTGYPDRLDLAIAGNEAATIEGGSVKHWTLWLEVGRQS